MVYDNNLGLRIGAYFIDGLILSLLMQILYLFNLGQEVELFDGVIIEMLGFGQIILLYIVYFVGFAIFNKGITVGKMATGLHIKRGDNEPLEDEKIIIREFLKVVFMPLNIISIISFLARQDHKALHDLIVDSIVVKPRKRVYDPYNLRGMNVDNNIEETVKTVLDKKTDPLNDGDKE